MKKRASKVAHNRPRPLYFTVQPRPTANSPELILHIKKSRDQRSVLLSVILGQADAGNPFICFSIVLQSLHYDFESRITLFFEEDKRGH